MRVLLTGSAAPPVPDGAWPAGPAPSGPEAAPDEGAIRPALRDVADWWAPHADEIDVAALAASGPGFLDALGAVGTEVLAGVVPGPDGAEVPVAVRRTAGADTGSRTVYVDASQAPATRTPSPRPAAGRAAAPGDGDASFEVDGHPVPVPARSSAAVGHLVALAADAARDPDGLPGRVVLATGGSVTHDAGLGLLGALAGAAAGGSTDDVVRAARAALGGTDLVAAVASGVPLLGLHGASAAVEERGVPSVVAQHLEGRLGAVAHDVTAAVERTGTARRVGAGGAPSLVGRDLLATAAAGRRLAALPGAGSGGGLGFAVAALGGRIVPALRVVADDTALDERLAAADLVVVLADELGAHELGDGTVRLVAAQAARHALPVVVVARAVVAGRREQAAAGVSSAYAWGDGDPRALVERVARTWARA